jgi:predicted dienelactone hydrolase
MRKTLLVFASIRCCLGSPARAAGIQLLNSDPGLAGAIWYPCAGEPKRVALGNLAVAADFSLMGMKDCPVMGAKLPLVIFSHGRTGWFGAHHDTAEALADAGFVVAAINHPGDNGNDPSRHDDLSVFASRPADMIRLLDFMLRDWKDKAVVDPAKIGFFGFSKGGYTGFVLIGVTPDFGRLARFARTRRELVSNFTTGKLRPTCHMMHVSRPRLLSIRRMPFLRGIIWPPSRSPSSTGDPNWGAQAWATVRAMLASQTACRANLTFTPYQPATLHSWRPARRNWRWPYRAFAPTCRASTG